MGKKVEMPGAFTEPVDTQPVPSPEPGEPETAGLADLGITSMDAIRTTATDPLIESGSRAAIGHNIKKEVEAGRPRKQAIAIALSVARKHGARIPKKRNKK